MSEETIIDDLIEQGTFRVQTFAGRVIDYGDELPTSINTARTSSKTFLMNEQAVYVDVGNRYHLDSERL